MIDFHAHILPGADHGSDSLDTSLYQVKSAENVGIDTIVATPHFYKNSDNISEFLNRREKSYNELISALKLNNINVNIIKAAEVTLQVDLLSVDDLFPLCIDKTNYMLLEMPMNVAWTSWHYDAVDEIINRGVKPIIAHINRYSTFSLEKLFEKDVLFQINIEAFQSFISRKRILKFYNQGFVDLIGSDIHEQSNIYRYWDRYQNKYKDVFEVFNKNAKIILDK